MKDIRKPPEYEPIKYDKSILHDGLGGFAAAITEDSDVTTFLCEKMEEAQRLLANFDPDFGERHCIVVPPSVFYPGTP